MFLFIAITLFSCSEVPQADVSGVIKEKRNRKLQKVSTGDIFLKAIDLGKLSIADSTARLITKMNDVDLLSEELALFEMYVEAAQDNYTDYNIQYYNEKEGILYVEPYYINENFVGMYSVKLEAAEVIRTMQITKKPF